jgi:hypothetical protein
MIRTGELLSPDEVLSELSQKDDTVYQWANTNGAMFLPLDEDIQRATQEILGEFPRLVGAMKDRNRADPFVIALSKVKHAIVVTGEKSLGTRDRPRIPIVCDHFGIGHRTMLELIRDKGWTFR